ncbi:TetR/AcrR family transcriptional regulator [Nocardioides sp. BGMRC 2183]|nr:TetR/AcrR family transcriptional regulator [Nocardioides sp. BGMRC 2183]
MAVDESTRTARKRRVRDPEHTRRVIVEAVLSSLEEGVLEPTAKQVAARAGVSERSVFVHFSDLRELRRAAAEEQAERIDALLEPVAPEGPLEHRLAEVLRQREALFEVQAGIRSAELIHAGQSAEVAAMVQSRRQGFRDQVAVAFAPELAALKDSEGALDLLEGLLDWSFRRQLVVRQRLDQAQASAAVRRAVLGVLVA